MSRTKHRMLAALLVGLAVAAVQGVSVPAASAGTVSRPGATPAAFAQGPPASAADLARVKTLAAGDDFGCEGSWRFISASNGKRWKVDASSDWVYADGTPGVEDWKQWFLFCRRASWQSDRYVLYANQGGRFVHTNTASLQLGAYGSLVDDTANSFYWRTYDGNFCTFMSWASVRWVTARLDLPRADLYATSWQLGNWELFLIREGSTPVACPR